MTAVPKEALDAAAARLHEALQAAWDLYNHLLSVALVIGCGIFLGRAFARSAVAGGFELGLRSAAKTVCLLSHAEKVGDLASAVEEAVLAAGDPPTREELAGVYLRAACLARACSEACEALQNEP